MHTFGNDNLRCVGWSTMWSVQQNAKTSLMIQQMNGWSLQWPQIMWQTCKPCDHQQERLGQQWPWCTGGCRCNIHCWHSSPWCKRGQAWKSSVVTKDQKCQPDSQVLTTTSEQSQNWAWPFWTTWLHTWWIGWPWQCVSRWQHKECVQPTMNCHAKLHKTLPESMWAVKKFLLEQIEGAKITDNKVHLKCLKNIKQAKQQDWAHAMIWWITKPKQAGSLRHLKPPVDPAANKTDPRTEWHNVTDAKEMESKLLLCSQQHFTQAEGTPFTQAPQKDLINQNGFSPFGDAILNGTADVDSLKLDQNTKLLLKHMQCHPGLLPKLEDMSQEDHDTGCHKWCESTSTCPSGVQLNICKSWLKDPCQLSKDGEEQDDREIQCGKDVMKIACLLSLLATWHAHVCNWWCNIWNLFLEKLCGDQKFTAHAQSMLWSMADEQGSSHKGCGTVDGAHKKVIACDIICMKCQHTGNLNNDATACHDHIIENQSNLNLWQQHVHPDCIKLHAEVHQKLKYFVKHKFRVSEEHNSDSKDHPWHGSGQGASDSGTCWIIISGSLICVCDSEANLWTAHHPDSHEWKQKSPSGKLLGVKWERKNSHCIFKFWWASTPEQTNMWTLWWAGWWLDFQQHQNNQSLFAVFSLMQMLKQCSALMLSLMTQHRYSQLMMKWH